MPTYKITDPNTGRILRVTGEKPPTQQDAAEIFASRTKPQDTRTGVQKVADFIGLGTTARNIGALGFAGQGARTELAGQEGSQSFAQANELIQRAKDEPNKEKRQLLISQARNIMSGAGERADVFRGELGEAQRRAGITERDIERGEGQFLARRGIGQTAELASLLAPSLLPGAGTVAGRIGQAGVRGALAGGLQGVAGATREAETVGEVAKDVGLGALFGAGTGAVLQGVFETPGAVKRGFKKLSKSARDKAVDLYGSTLKENIRDKKFIQQAGGIEKLTNDSVNLNIPNTRGGVSKELDNFAPKFGERVTKEAAKAERAGKTINIRSAYEKAKRETIKRLKDEDDLLAGANKYFSQNDNRFLNKANQSAKPISANKLRIRLDKRTGALITDEITQGKQLAKKLFATELRNEFKNAVPALKGDIRRFQLLSGLSEAMKKEPALGITEVAAAAASPGKGIGNLFELLAAKAVRSPGLRRAAAGTVIRAGQGRISQEAVKKPSVLIAPAVSALQRAIDREQKSIQERKRLP